MTSGNINRNAPYIWNNKAFPKALGLSGAWDADERTAITAMGSAWSDAFPGSNVAFFNHSSNVTEKTQVAFNMDSLLDSEFGIYKTTRWPESLPVTALAVTQIYGYRNNIGDSDEFVGIEHADILVNYDRYTFFNDTPSARYDLRGVMLHEMGHFLGLQHVNNPQSIMLPTMAAGDSSRRVPGNYDKAVLADKYVIPGFSANAAIAADRQTFNVRTQGEMVKILIELHADGECVHRENGTVVKRHSLR